MPKRWDVLPSGVAIHFFEDGVSMAVFLFSDVEMDDEDCERRRMECLDEMTNLEKQFTDLKDQ